MFKKFIQTKLEKSVVKFFQKHPDVKLIAVVGSVGKTSTKIAIGTVLAEKYRVAMQENNHNTELSAPLAILGIEFPENVRSIGQWLTVFRAIRKRINMPSGTDVVIQELGTDGPGQIPHFGTYLKPDITVVTSVAPEHMEFFGTMDAVAMEELSAANFSKLALINRDDIDGEYAKYITDPVINTYGTTDTAEYRFETLDYSYQDGFTGTFIAPEFEVPVPTTLRVMGEHSVRMAVAAGAVGAKLGLTTDEVSSGLGKIKAVSGRMNVLRGMQDSILIDDSYNSSPIAAASALRALYQLNVPQRIAVLGSMNELGDMAPAAHAQLGDMCDPVQLTHVITVGELAAQHLAPVARENGCHVVSVRSPLEAGALVNKYRDPGAAILYKGSQGDIFLEEAVKMSLLSIDDEEQLVRQSAAWMKKKQAFFDSLEPTPLLDD